MMMVPYCIGDPATGISPLRLRTTLEVSPRSVVLITRDDASGDLVVR